MSIIRFYPLNEKIKSFATPPEPASKRIPDWYKRQPAQVHTDKDLSQGIVKTTIKKCMPIFDMISAGYIISMPCDVYVDATNPEELVFSVPAPMKQFQGDIFASHSREQYSDYPLDIKIHHRDLLRIHPLYAIGTEKGYSTIFLQPPHREGSPLQVFQAIADTDGYASDGHFSFLVEKNFKGIIKQGTPIVQAIPFKRDSFVSETVPTEESDKVLNKQRFSVKSSFTNGYKDKLRSKKDYR